MVGEHLRQTYLRFDSRSLAAFRMALASTLLLDLALRAFVADDFYTNSGLIPNHTLLWSPPAKHMFSLFYAASHYGEVLLGMVVCGVCFLMLLVGYRTRLAQVLSLLCVFSLDQRLIPLENGGDVVINHLCVWSLFLPLGRRFSVDALLQSLRERRETHVSQLADRAALRRPAEQIQSLAVLAMLLQFTVIYFFNVAHKDGPTWMKGSAVHYTLHQDRIATWLAVFLRENAPYELLQGLTYATIGWEALGAALIIFPLWVDRTRLAAFLLMPTLHLGFAMCLNLGAFSYAMAAFFPILLRAVHWETAKRMLARAYRPRVCLVDAHSSFCFSLARLVARLDVLERIELREREADTEHDDRELAVIEQDGSRTRGMAAVRSLLRSLPGGTLPAMLLAAPGLRQLSSRLYERACRRRQELGVYYFGQETHAPGPAALQAKQPTPFSRTTRRAGRVVNELGVAFFMIVGVGETLNVNSAVPKWMRYQQPAPLQTVVEYGRLIQGWRMFAPHAPTHDEMVVVEATTVDGRLVDPYNEEASRIAPVPLERIPKALGNDQFFCTYSLHIPSQRSIVLRGPFEQWLLRYHERTGNPKDRIVRFVAYRMVDQSPKPGQTEPTQTRKIEFMRYPKK